MTRLKLVVSLVSIFLSIEGLCQTYFLNGDALAIGNDCYNITPNSSFQNGTVWYANQLNLSLPFELEFYMSFGSNDANGADGMVFVLQTQGTDAIGLVGSGMGFQGFNPSFGIEFDTYSNNAQSDPGGNMNDPLADHVAFLRNGNVNHNSTLNLAGPVQADASNANIETGQSYPIRISWDPSTDQVSLYFNCQLRLTHTIDLHNVVFNGNPMVYFGFTGSTGFYFNPQSVCLQQNIVPSPESLSICEGETVILNAGGNPNGTFQWSPITGLNSSTIQSPEAAPTTTTTYTVQYQDLCGNNLTKDFNVNVTPTPTANAGSDLQICEGEIAVTNSSTDQGNSITWTTSNGSIVGPTNEQSISISSSGTYQMNVSTTDGCTNNDAMEVVVLPAPTVTLPNNLQVCEGEVTDLTAVGNFQSLLWSTNQTSNTISVGAGSYSVTAFIQNCEATANTVVDEVDVPPFSLGPDIEACETEVTLLNAGIPVQWSTGVLAPTITITASGNYSATLEVSGCSTSDDINVLIYENPTINLGDDSFICPDESLVIELGQDAEWQDGTFSSQMIVNSPGTITAIVTNGECEVSDSRSFTLKELPVIELGEDITICDDEQVFIGDTNTEAVDFSWNTGSSENLIEVFQSDLYILTATNECGSVADTISVTIEDCDYYLYIPSAFTPDNDGINDVWKIETYLINRIEIYIFDRWGNTVFYTNDPSVPWLGDFKGGDYYLQNGVYQYYIKFLAKETETGERHGHITLLR